MPRPRLSYPVPHVRIRGGYVHLMWRDGDRGREFSLGAVTPEVAEVRRLELQLGFRTGNYPQWFPVHLRRDANPRAERPRISDDPIADYSVIVHAECCPDWAGAQIATLRELAQFAPVPLLRLNGAHAREFLAHVSTTPGPKRPNAAPRSTKTRNDILNVCRRFFTWAQQGGLAAMNPFANIPHLRRADPIEIVYLTHPEREAVLHAADADPDGLGLYLALFAGLRRGEVARARWRDIAWREQRLLVYATKTGRRRTVPISARLLTILSEHAVADAEALIVPRWSRFARIQYGAQYTLGRIQAACSDIPRERIGWNPFRHTFASLLVQAGVSLDKLSAWMGNSPQVCRTYYAQFIPRGEHDADIDRADARQEVAPCPAGVRSAISS